MKDIKMSKVKEKKTVTLKKESKNREMNTFYSCTYMQWNKVEEVVLLSRK